MKSSPTDVIVVGGGAAGLQAAIDLARRGTKVIVLEARDRLGGRIFDKIESGWPRLIELGAEFVHGGNPTLAKCLRRARLRTDEVSERHWRVRPSQRKQMDDNWARLESVFQLIDKRKGWSVADGLHAHRGQISPEDHRMAVSFVTGFQGAPVQRMSARTMREMMKKDDEQRRLKGGYGRLIEALSSDLARSNVAVVLNCCIDRIQWSRGRVTVLSGAREWKAIAVVVTLPIGVLQASASERAGVTFSPPLKARQTLWRRAGVGHAVRVVLQMRRDIWRRGVIPAELRAENGRSFGFQHSDEELFPVWWAQAPDPVLIGWTGGPAVGQLSGLRPIDVFQQARRSLANVLGVTLGALTDAIVDWRTYNWSEDPFTRGAYSYSVAGAEDVPKRMARPIAGTLFFAGEATADPVELGTVHGALSSGARVAREVMALSPLHPLKQSKR